MALSVKRVTLWRTDVDNRAGVLASTLAPLAAVGADLRVVQADSLIANPKPEAPMGIDGWVTVTIPFMPVTGRTYYVYAALNDIHGNKVERLLTLVAR